MGDGSEEENPITEERLNEGEGKPITEKTLTRVFVEPAPKEIAMQLRAWCNHEHSLINNRISWLLASTAFLLGIVELSVSKAGSNVEWFTLLIPVFGIWFSYNTYRLVNLADMAIKCVRARENKLYNKPDNAQGKNLLNLMHIDYCYEQIKPRDKNAHPLSMRLTKQITWVVFCVWVLAFLLLGYQKFG